MCSTSMGKRWKALADKGTVAFRKEKKCVWLLRWVVEIIIEKEY